VADVTGEKEVPDAHAHEACSPRVAPAERGIVSEVSIGETASRRVWELRLRQPVCGIDAEGERGV